MSERVPAQNKNSATPSQATQSNSPLIQQRPFTDEQYESVGSNSKISNDGEGIKPKTIRRSLNWQNIAIEAPSPSNGMSLPGGIQRQQEQQEHQVSADSEEKSALELSNSTISTDAEAQQPKIARAGLNWRNISVEAPSRSGGDASPQPIQRQQETEPKEEKSAEESGNSTISTDFEPQQPKIARAGFNWRNISVEAPSRSGGEAFAGAIQRASEEEKKDIDLKPEAPAIARQVSGATEEKSSQEVSNSTISTDSEAQKPKIARSRLDWRNISIEAPSRGGASSTYPGIQRQETSDKKEKEESTQSLQMQSEGEIQAKCSECQREDEEQQKNESVQTKLTVGAPGDKYEQEADSMAAKVMTMPDSAIQQPIQRQTEEETEAVGMQPLVNSITPLVQRSLGEEEEVQMKSGVQRASDGSSQASASVENRLAGSKGGGSALPDDVRSFMEPRFGADFSSVRVHTDSTAVQMNKELGAQAFAHGSDIYYGAGKSPGKNELTAHELTHTVQQGGAVRTKSVTQEDKKENKLQAKADLSQSPVLEPKIQRKENPQAQPAAAKVAAPAPKAPAASPAESVPGGTQAKTIEKPAAGGDAGEPAARAGGGGGGAVGAPSGGAAGGAVGGGGENSAKSAQSDPGFQAVVNSTKSVATQEKNHPPAGTKSAEAQAAAVSPANEVESKAQDKQVQEMNQQQPGQFNAGAFKAALMQKIAAATPQTLEEADKFKDQNKLDSVKGDLSSQVGDEKKQAADPIEEKTKEQPSTEGITPKPVTPLPPKQAGKAPSDIGADKAAPKPKSESEVSLQEGSKSIDKQMADAQITDQQLAKSNEPQFQTALETKKTAQTNANTAPNAYRQQEQGIVTQAQTQAQTTAQTQLQGMHGEKEQLLTQVVGLQVDTKGQDEQKRSEVANHIQGIYNNTKQKVETLLSQLDGEVTQQFDQGASAAKTEFENYVDGRMKRYKDERYSGFLGPGKWLKDKLLGMPSEVNTFYQEGKNKFLASMDKTIDNIANHVAKKLNAAKSEIAKGKQQISKYVAGLDPSLKQVGQQAAQDIQGKFDELEQSVDSKQNELIDNLAQKYNENLQALDSRIEQMKAENRGLVDKAMDAVGGVIKTILEMKNLLMGVLAKAAGAVEKIIKDPVGFLGNLVTGLKQGFQNFTGNIWEHLKKGLMGWLTEAVSGAVELPESLDLKGIFTLVMQVLGLSYDYIRGKAAHRLGEKKVNHLEGSFDIFIALKNQGIAGLWTFIQDKIGDLKSMVLDGIQNFVVESIIKAGVTWVLSLLNPASAFVRACKMIIDIVMFFIERGSQIAELVSAVLDSVTAIAGGAIGSAAQAVENALSKSLPVVISFMASLVGLGGISEKVQSIIGKARKPVDKGIDWVLGKAEKYAAKFKDSKFGKKLESGKQWATKKKEAAQKWVGEKKEAGQKWFANKKAAIEKGIEEKKNKFFDTKVGKKLAAADEWGRKQFEKLDKKREAFNNKLNAIKEYPQKKLAAWKEAGKEKFKNSKLGQKLSGKSGTPTDKMKDAPIKNEGKDNKSDTKEEQRPYEDKKQDLETAQKTLQEIISQSENTKEVERHFPTMKKQFGLKKLEWDKLGTPSASIIMEINPKAIIDLSNSKLILSKGNTTHSNQFQQEVTFETDKIDNKYLVGKKMEATKLGPNHPQGSPPLGGALNLLMKHLPTDPSSKNDEKYIKGHLLNDNLGGPGSAQNLYPITADANSQHVRQVESVVKNWVNNEGYWVYYKVQVANEKVNLANGEINADLVCEAARLDVDGNKSFKGAINTTIHSELGKKRTHTQNKINKDEFSNKDAIKDPSFDRSKVELASGNRPSKKRKREDIEQDV